MQSPLLGATRRIDVVLPPSWKESPPSRRYPVAVIFDGETTLPATAAAAGELMRNAMIPELILVAIANAGGAQARVHDLTPPGLSVSGSTLNEGGDRFLDFIEKELLPTLDRQLRGGEPRILVGHSSGAILATYAAATRTTYRAVLAIDAPIALGQNWLARQLLGRAARGGAPLRYASYEAKFGWPDDAWRMLAAAAPPSWKLHRESLRLEGHETLYMLGAYLGLRELFSDYSALVSQEKPAAVRLPHYAAVSEQFGADLVPPKRLLRETIDDLTAEGRGAAAREAYALYAAGYGAPSDSVQLLGDIVAAERRPAPAETVESLLGTPFPTPAEASRFVGDWTGSQWMTPSEPRNNQVTLRIRIENGRTVAELLNAAAPAEHRVRKVDYLRVTPAGLTYGFLNGMRPRGVVLWEGTLRGDTLSGKQRWGGVAFAYPPGSNLEPGFRFTRARR